MSNSKYLMMVVSTVFTFILLASNAQASLNNKSTTISADEPIIEDSRAININFFGGFTGFDPISFKLFKTGIANLIVEGVVDHYITTGWGLEGGNSFCVELSKDPNVKMSRVTDMLQVIKPTNNTIYNYSVIKSCVKEN